MNRPIACDLYLICSLYSLYSFCNKQAQFLTNFFKTVLKITVQLFLAAQPIWLVERALQDDDNVRADEANREVRDHGLEADEVRMVGSAENVDAGEDHEGEGNGHSS